MELHWNSTGFQWSTKFHWNFTEIPVSFKSHWNFSGMSLEFQWFWMHLIPLKFQWAANLIRIYFTEFSMLSRANIISDLQIIYKYNIFFIRRRKIWNIYVTVFSLLYNHLGKREVMSVRKKRKKFILIHDILPVLAMIPPNMKKIIWSNQETLFFQCSLQTQK